MQSSPFWPMVRLAVFWMATVSGLCSTREEGSKHWAFQPVRQPSLPSVRNQAWPVNAIDRFILARLEEKGLAPSEPADRATLLRRATFDLTGLPPSAEEVEAFLDDPSPDAFATVVERLLASPHYGERWGRYWLDVARYSDTKGYVYDREEKRFVHSHVYRDWVVRALNEDMAYDRFLLLQLAGDRIVKEVGQGNNEAQVNAESTALAAMGYLTLGRRFLGVVHDIIDDRIDVVGRGMLGLTISCARCHDHKFDPIPIRDYYSLYGIFASTSEETVALLAGRRANAEFEEYERGLNERVGKLEQTFAKKRAQYAERLRAQASRYLEAVLDVSALPSEEFYAIMGPEDVNPVIVRQWEAYLFKNKQRGSDRVLGLWHELAALQTNDFAARSSKVLEKANESAANVLVLKALLAAPPLQSMRDVAARYGATFSDVDKMWRDAVATAKKTGQAAPASLEKGAEEIRQILYGADSPARVPNGAIVDVEWFFDEGGRVELAKLQAEIDRWVLKAPGAPPHAVILRDRATPYHPRVFLRGNAANKGEEVPRRFLEVLSPAQRQPYEHGSGRLEMAGAIASPQNPLTARVMVNRLWQQHFGAGLVRTVSDFGLRSDPPSHPQLLDWLATEFVAKGWSLKHMHRLIMLSRVYQQTSMEADKSPATSDSTTVDGAQIDPENRLLRRMNRQRLDFESMRDSLLAVAGELDLTLGGKATELFGAKGSKRRTIYGFIDRQFVDSTLRCFDFANPDMHSPARAETTVPQQALFFLNSEFVVERARQVAASLPPGEITERIGQLYRRIYQRAPTTDQLAAGREFIEMNDRAVEPEPPKPAPSDWRYGFGHYDAVKQRFEEFTPLPHFTGEAWQGGTAWPDAKLGWVQLTADGGHAGNDLQHVAIRRWVAPRDSVVEIRGRLSHDDAAGDGIHALVVSSRAGLLEQWTLHNTNVTVRIAGVKVQAGDTIDFGVDVRENLNSDMFKWRPIITSNDPGVMADAKKDFGGPPETLKPLKAWEKYAQVLLQGNEFLFVD